MKAFLLAAVLVSAFGSANAFAWGSTGHRVVGAVAEKNLEPAVALKIYKILGGNSLSRVANWPDEIKSEPETYSHTYNWHYTDWKDEDHNHDETNSSGKLLTSIREQVAVLKNAASPDDKKAFAIKFIVHLVGDLHQPLHVGNGNDRGGNNCKVQFQKKDTNLHALWDEALIDFTNLSFSELAGYVAQGRTREEVAAWRSGDVLEWAQESKELRNTIYPADSAKYCKQDVAAADVPKLGYEYSYKFVPVMEKRLFQAGLRLALVLNDALK